MGVKTSFFISEGVPFDMSSEDFGALLWQSEASIGINCHRDETMVLYYGTLSKRKSMEWCKPGKAPPRKAKVTQSTKKIMATIFWNFRGILLINFKERNTTVNAAYYASLLHKLRDAIKEKRRGILRRAVRLLHDYAPVHMAVFAKAAVDCGFEIEHPPYSPDLAPCVYYLFSELKEDLRGKKFDENC